MDNRPSTDSAGVFDISNGIVGRWVCTGFSEAVDPAMSFDALLSCPDTNSERVEDCRDFQHSITKAEIDKPGQLNGLFFGLDENLSYLAYDDSRSTR